LPLLQGEYPTDDQPRSRNAQTAPSPAPRLFSESLPIRTGCHGLRGRFRPSRPAQPFRACIPVSFGPANPPGNLTVDREVCVERFIGVDDARSSLVRLVEQVAAGGDVVALTKRGKALAVLVSRDEYLQMKLVVSERARAELAEALGSARRKVREAGLDAGMIDEAIAAARQL